MHPARLAHVVRYGICTFEARTVSEVMQEVRGFFTLGHLLYAYAYLRMLHYKEPSTYVMSDAAL